MPDILTHAFAESMRERFQPDRKPFAQGYAWALLPRDPRAPDGLRLAFKDGGTAGFNSVIVVDADTDLAVFVVADMAKSGVPTLGIAIARQAGDAQGSSSPLPQNSEDSLTSEP